MDYQAFFITQICQNFTVDPHGKLLRYRKMSAKIPGETSMYRDAGTIVHPNSGGKYIKVYFDGKIYPGEFIAYICHYREIPTAVICVDGNRFNFLKDNLLQVPKNARRPNYKKPRYSIPGVVRLAESGAYKVYIHIPGLTGNLHLGYYQTFPHAVEVRAKASNVMSTLLQAGTPLMEIREKVKAVPDLFTQYVTDPVTTPRRDLFEKKYIDLFQ